MDLTTPSVKAGETYQRATENDPDAQAALEHARSRMQVFGNAMQAVVKSVDSVAVGEMFRCPFAKATQEAERQCWQDWAAAIRQATEAAGDELESRHFNHPETIED